MSVVETRTQTPEGPKLGGSAQRKLMVLLRCSYNFKPRGQFLLNQKLIKVIDRQFLEYPIYGVERIRNYLIGLGYPLVWSVSKGFTGLWIWGLSVGKGGSAKRNLSETTPADYKHPYLLKVLKIERFN